jgi:hypothetical protein
MTSQPERPDSGHPEPSDQRYFDQLAERIDRLGVQAEHRSNLLSVASRLLWLRQLETDPRDQERLDLELEALMQLLDGRPADPPRADEIDQLAGGQS